VKFVEVTDAVVENSEFTNTENQYCYELRDTSNLRLNGNTCTVRQDRKVKCQNENDVIESDNIDIWTVEESDPSPTCLRSPPSTPTPMSSPSPTETMNPCPDDENGFSGKIDDTNQVCCDSRCIKCSGSGCGKSSNGPGRDYCCRGKIKRSGREWLMTQPHVNCRKYRVERYKFKWNKISHAETSHFHS